MKNVFRACLPLLSLVMACGGGGGTGTGAGAGGSGAGSGAGGDGGGVAIGGEPTVIGTIGGKSFAAVEAVSSAIAIDYSPAGAIFISSAPGYCALVTAHEVPQNAAVMNILLGQYDPTSQEAVAPTKPGTFTVVGPNGGTGPAGNVAQATYVEVGAGCKQVAAAQAVGGTVTLDAVDNGAYRGRADLMLDTGDAITVEFDAQACAAINWLFDSSAHPACQ